MPVLRQLTTPSWRDVLMAVGVGIPIGAWSVALVWLAAPTSLPVLVPAILTGHLSLVWRRIAPELAFILVSMACCVQVVAAGGIPLLPSLVVFPLSLYACCAYGERRAPLTGLAVGTAGAVVMVVEFVVAGQASQLNLPPLLLLGFLLAVVLAAFSSGLFRRTQLAYVAALEDRAVRAETEREERARRAVLEERTRIARDMHDVIAHSLSVIVSQARGGKYAGRAKPERAVEVLSSIEETGRQALADIRGLVGLLRSDEHADGTGWGPQPTLEQLPGLLDRVRDSGLMVDYTDEGQPFALGLAAELSIFRLVQEALTNTMKHAGSGASAQVRLAWAEDELVVTVCDDGVGQRPGDGMGHGLIGMRERLAVVGGSMSAGPSPDGGFLVSARLPRRTERTDP